MTRNIEQDTCLIAVDNVFEQVTNYLLRVFCVLVCVGDEVSNCNNNFLYFREHKLELVMRIVSNFM